MGNEQHAYRIRRTTRGPVMRVQVTEPRPEGEGPTYVPQVITNFFTSAGEDGSEHILPAWAAEIMMADPGHQEHFDCIPPLPASKSVEPAAEPAGGDEPAASTAAPEGSQADGQGTRRVKAGRGRRSELNP